MTKFFYELTKRNWGWPYHIILADVLATGFLVLYLFLWGTVELGFNFGVVWLCVNTIGYTYEAIQANRDVSAKEEFWEDMIANNVGIILACVKFWIIIKLF